MGNSGGGGGGPKIDLGPIGEINLGTKDLAAMIPGMGAGPIGMAAGLLASSGTFGEGIREGINNLTYRTGIDNVVGEATGANFKRQQEWQAKVKQDAVDAQNAQFAEDLAARKRNDINSSRMAARKAVPGGRGGDSLEYDGTLGDTTDFLGL